MSGVEIVALAAAGVAVVSTLGWLASVRLRARSRDADPARLPSGGCRRLTERKTAAAASTVVEERRVFPPSGLMVPDEVLGVAGTGSSSPEEIWGALEASAAPVAVAYRPVTNTEARRLTTVPVNATLQGVLKDLATRQKPSGEVLYTVVLPKGMELVKAVGQEGYRGFSRTAGQTAHALLKPVAAGGAVGAAAIGWPVLAVAGTVLAMDAIARREQKAGQRRVEASLARIDERYYVERITAQRTADAQLSRAISLILDGQQPPVELALQSAYDVFHDAEQFLNRHYDLLASVTDTQGHLNYKTLEARIGKDDESAHFFRELDLARAAVALRQKALVTDAASVALAAPGNAYVAMRQVLERQAAELAAAEKLFAGLTEGLRSLEVRRAWNQTRRGAQLRHLWLHDRLPAPAGEDFAELSFLVTSEGDVRQVVTAGELKEIVHNDEGDQGED